MDITIHPSNHIRTRAHAYATVRRSVFCDSVGPASRIWTVRTLRPSGICLRVIVDSKAVSEQKGVTIAHYSYYWRCIILYIGQQYLSNKLNRDLKSTLSEQTYKYNRIPR